jgi:hypothetical protein
MAAHTVAVTATADRRASDASFKTHSAAAFVICAVHVHSARLVIAAVHSVAG